jgi:hypothetical protein
MKKFHLAWFGNQSPSGWRKPSGQLFDWRQADIYLETARLCERAKFDMVLFADSLAVPAVLGGSRDWSVAHGHHVAMDPAPTVAIPARAFAEHARPPHARPDHVEPGHHCQQGRRAEFRPRRHIGTRRAL